MIDFAWFFKIIWKTDWVCLEGDWQHQTQQPIIRISKPQQLVVMHVLNSFERESLYRFCALTVSFVEAGRIARPALGWSSFLHNKRTVHSSLVFAERFSAKMKNEESCKPLEIYVYIYTHYILTRQGRSPLTVAGLDTCPVLWDGQLRSWKYLGLGKSWRERFLCVWRLG